MPRKPRKIAAQELDPDILSLVRALAIAYARADHEAEIAGQRPPATPEPPP
jgi:hypothetical protein